MPEPMPTGETMEMKMLYPEQKVFKRGDISAFAQVKNSTPLYWIERVETPEVGGQMIYYKGVLQPTKGFIFPEALQAVNRVKAVARSYLEVARNWVFFPSIILIGLLPFKTKVKMLNKMIVSVTRPFQFIVDPYLLKDHYYIPITASIRKLIQITMSNLGFTVQACNRASDLIGAIIEYDNAYRFRLEDMMTEGKPELFYKNPGKEMRRIFKIAIEREMSQDIKKSYKQLSLLASVLFLSKKVRKAFIKALQQIDYQTMVFDEIDWHNILLRGDYDFGGKSASERQFQYIGMYKGVFPPMYVAV